MSSTNRVLKSNKKERLNFSGSEREPDTSRGVRPVLWGDCANLP